MIISNSKKGVIAYLSRSNAKDINDLKRSLALLDTHFNDRFHYPVVIFHEDFKDDLIENVKRSSRSLLKFEKIEFKLPKFIDQNEIPKVIYVNNYPFSIGYRHMCRFMSMTIFQHPVIREYEYLWRLDTDSFILGKINYDIFEFMKLNGFIYGYLTIEKDKPEAIQNLWVMTKNYIDNLKITPKYLDRFISDGKWDMSYYYTNFEISKINFWLSEGPSRFFEYIDNLGGIYKYRWGDHVIHLLTLSIFAEKNKVFKFTDIPYQHQKFITNFSVKEISIHNGELFKKMILLIFTPILKLSKCLMIRFKFFKNIMEIYVPIRILRRIWTS